jgi:hypothetical protein
LRQWQSELLLGKSAAGIRIVIAPQLQAPLTLSLGVDSAMMNYMINEQVALCDIYFSILYIGN